jgi:hypothetical protein
VPIFRETRGKRRKVLKEINVGDNYRINSRKKGDKYINGNCLQSKYSEYDYFNLDHST